MVMLLEIWMDDRLIDCHTELKRLRDLQYEFDFNDNNEQSIFYKQKAEYIQSLINKGIDYIPNFWS